MANYIDRLLEETLLSLMKQKKLNDITATELIETAEINRKTFYNHYSGIGAMLAQMVIKRLGQYMADGVGPDEWFDVTIDVLKEMKKNASFYRTVFRSKYRSEIEFALKDTIQAATVEFVERAASILEKESGQPRPLTERQQRYLVMFYSSMMISLISEWFENGMKEPIEEFVVVIDTLCNRGVFAGIDFFQEQEKKTAESA